jgi:co-chaperonin GroES (HSP10)
MNFKPANRHLLVELLVEQEKDETGVLLPEEYCTQNEFVSCRVLSISGDCTRNALKGNTIVVRNSMIEEVNVQGNTFYLVLENHVMGITSD